MNTRPLRTPALLLALALSCQTLAAQDNPPPRPPENPRRDAPPPEARERAEQAERETRERNERAERERRENEERAR
ncbi:MAG TPA: hypothetical protein PK490_22885, partial [Prosthecobacter sp.]|nr:hypothetical protein [Prosthecobacter sp.]